MKEDWFLIITRIERSGLSQEQIGRKVGRDASTICRYKEGNEPKHSVGQMLLTLYETRCINIAEMQST